MPPLGFPRKTLSIFVLLLGLLFAVPAIPVLGSLTFLTEPPLQRHYLLPYLESSTIFRRSSPTTPIAWLYKVAPGRRRALLLDRDVQAENRAKLGLGLSAAAQDEGWTGIEAGAPEKVDSAKLHAALQAGIFNGHSTRWIIGEPLALGFLAVVAFAIMVVAIKRRLSSPRREEERHGRRTKGPELVSPAEWNGRLRPDGLRFQLHRASLGIRRNLESNHILIMGDSGSGKTSAMRQILRQVSSRQAVAVVYDPALEFTPEFYAPERGDIILNPLDARCPIGISRRNPNPTMPTPLWRPLSSQTRTSRRTISPTLPAVSLHS